MVGRVKGVWHPDLVGVVRGYAKTLEAFQITQARCLAMVTKANAEGRAGRKGVPDGFAGRKAEVHTIKQAAAVEAKELVKKMIDEEMLDAEDPRAEEALEDAVAVIRARDGAGKHVYQVRERLMAGNLLCAYLKTKPIARSKVEVANAESFLASLAAK